METEPEIKAMNDVYVALKELEDDAKKRVIEWVTGKFSLARSRERAHPGSMEPEAKNRTEGVNLSSFGSVADVFGKAGPKSESDKVLIVASYLQEGRGVLELTGRQINKELSQLGHGVGNITAAINSLMKKKPQLMIQTRKEGKTKQAQKKYKVTGEGFGAAKKMISPMNQHQE